jgi:2-(1,2-epoxy-1,2-dihydrophenyl)acetyl-CoA isomerase
MDTESNDHLAIDLQGTVLTATLCRGDVGNGMDRVLANSLAAFASQVVEGAKTGSVRVAVLRNEGFGFCVGGDLTHFTNASNLPTELQYVAETIHDALKTLTTAPVPIVTVVDGVAAGGGVGLALVGDIVIGTPATKFKMSYTSVGLSPDCGGSWFLSQRVGLGRALEMTLTDRTVAVEEAEKIGLVGPVCGADADLDQMVKGLTGRLTAMSKDSLATTKRLIRSSVTRDLFDQLDDEAHHITRLSATPDGAEGVRAFSEKRLPAFG